MIYNDFKNLKGTWYLSAILGIIPPAHDLKFLVYMRKLQDGYEFSSPPFFKNSLHFDRDKSNLDSIVIFPIQELLYLRNGMIFKDGKPIVRDLNTYEHTYEIEYLGGFNPAMPLKDILNHNEWGFIDFISNDQHENSTFKKVREELYNVYFTKLEKGTFKLSSDHGKFDPNFVLIPSVNILQNLFFSTPRMIGYTFNPSFSIKDDLVIDFSSTIDFEGRRNISLLTNENFKPYDYHIIANLLTNDETLRMYQSCQRRLQKSFMTKDKHSFHGVSAYLPENVSNLDLYGKKVQIGTEWGLLAYDIRNMTINFSYDQLTYASLIDGRQGENKDDPSLIPVKRSKPEPKNLDNINNSTDDPENSLPFEAVISNNSINGLPESERMSKEDQKYKVETIIKKQKEKDNYSTSGSISSDEGPGSLVYDPEESDSNQEKKIVNNLNMFFESVEILNYDFGLNFRIIHQEIHEINDREYCKYLNTIPLNNLETKAKNFCKFYKISRNNWAGRRGIIILQLESNGRYFYVLEIEPRIKERSSDRFKTLVFCKNGQFITDETLLDIMFLTAKCSGNWREAKSNLMNFNISYAFCQHTSKFHENIKKKGLKLMSE